MDKDFSLLLDLYELTMGECYRIYRPDAQATFDLFVRGLPVNRSYLVAAGLADILEYVKRLRFNASDIRYLRSRNIFSGDFLQYLGKFRFHGDIWAMPEGTVFFPDEPVLRVTAPLIEAQVVESFLLNTINLQTMIASKASRVVSAARGKTVFDFSLRRTHGSDAGLKVARSAYLAGFGGTATVLAGKRYGIPIVGTMAHSYVMSFKEELDSFLAYAETFPSRAILLVDTYDMKKGIENAVTAGLYLKEKGARLQGIRLDSGDIVSWSKKARAMLDKAGLPYVKIVASGNLDEFKIAAMLKRGACVDSFGVGTNMGTSIDAPCLDVIYKISEITDEDGNFLPTMKLSKAKKTYPGRKQVFRIKDGKGRNLRDVLGLEGEDIRGEPLLVKAVERGKIIYKNPSLKSIRGRAKNQLVRFPAGLRDIRRAYAYPVIISKQLKRLRNDVTRRLKKRQA
jgi:nicotinate phosphoribosyltransferase